MNLKRESGLEDSYLEKSGGWNEKANKNYKVIVMKFSCVYKGLLDSFPHISLTLWTILLWSGIKDTCKPSVQSSNNVSIRHQEVHEAQRHPGGVWREITPFLNMPLQSISINQTPRTDSRTPLLGVVSAPHLAPQILWHLVCSIVKYILDLMSTSNGSPLGCEQNKSYRQNRVDSWVELCKKKKKN